MKKGYIVCKEGTTEPVDLISRAYSAGARTQLYTREYGKKEFKFLKMIKSKAKAMERAGELSLENKCNYIVFQSVAKATYPKPTESDIIIEE